MSKTTTTQKIDKLTPEQEAMLPVYEEKYLKIGLSTEPCDRARSEKAIMDSYKYLKLSPVKRILWADSPFMGAKLAASLAEGKPTKELIDIAPDLAVDAKTGALLAPVTLTNDEIRKQGDTASYGSFDAYWVSFYSFIAEQLPVEKDELIDIINEIVKNTGVYWTFEDVVICTEKPVAIHMKDKKLHCLTGKALEYRDGTGLYAVNGEVKNSLMEVILASNYEEKQSA
jgi:hypothetical protein